MQHLLGNNLHLQCFKLLNDIYCRLLEHTHKNSCLLERLGKALWMDFKRCQTESVSQIMCAIFLCDDLPVNSKTSAPLILSTGSKVSSQNSLGK